MAPSVSSSRVQLSYPLYAADFDPFNPDFLLVGGGGGSSATGVPNKISLIDASRRDQLKEVVDIELAKDEDSVTSLAVAESSPVSLTAFAGINSSVADRNAGKNEHLRSFRIGLPARKRRADGSTVEVDAEKPLASVQVTQSLGRAALFRSVVDAKSETYQRVLRFSPAQKPGEPRLAAVASGLGPTNEIIVFHPKPQPGLDSVVSRVELASKEAEDVDLAPNEGEKGGYVLAYCTNDEVFMQQLPITSTPEAPTSLFRASEISTSLPPSQRPKFRAIRFLTPRLLLLLRNRPQRSGADLLVLRVSKDCSQARMVLRKQTNNSIKAAVGLDVAPLGEVEGEEQSVIAVGGIPGDNSAIEILTLDYSRDTGLGSFRSFTYLKDVHNGPVTRLVFSNFIGPKLPVSGEVGPQSLRLASVGVDKSVVVQHIPLRPFPATVKTPRYVLIPPGRSEVAQTTFSVFFAIVVIGFVAFLMQAFCEIRGVVPPVLGAPDWLSPRMRELVGQPYMLAHHASSAASDIPVAAHSAVDEFKKSADDISATLSSAVAAATEGLKNLVEENSNLETPKAIIVREESLGEISTEVIHSDAEVVKQETLKKWEELSESQKKSWKRKLVDAGHWAEQQGENVLKGILFSELAGAVGNMVG
jgi:glycyl-tRNA synthetase